MNLRTYRNDITVRRGCDRANRLYILGEGVKWMPQIDPRGSFRFAIGYRNPETNRIVYLGAGK